MFLLTNLEKINEIRLKFSQGSAKVLQKIANYQEARVKLTNTQLKKLKSDAKNNTGKTLRITKKNFQDDVFVNHMLADIKLSKSQFAKNF